MVIASEFRVLAASLMPWASSASAKATHSKRRLLFLVLIFFYFPSNIPNLMRTNFFRASLMKNTTIRGVYIHIHVSLFYILLYWEENERKKFSVLSFFHHHLLLFLQFHKRTKLYNIMQEYYRVVQYTLCVCADTIADVTQFSSSPKIPPEPSPSSVASSASCYHRM